MDYRTALEIALASLGAKSGDDHLKAAVSHWLHDPLSLPPDFSEEYKTTALSAILDGRKSQQPCNTHDFPFNDKDSGCLPISWESFPYPPPGKWDFTFIDLFAGIGGFRQALQDVGGKNVFSSEWDKFAKKTYEENYGETPYGDIRKIDKRMIPDHDVLCAGFPCQPFSLAGVSKKNSLGKKHGFEDETQGTLFFEIKEIIRIKRPKAIFLENVKNLLSHDMGRTFDVILRTLEKNLGYVVNFEVINGVNWVPQNRERVFIVGYDPKQVSVKKTDIKIPKIPGPDYEYPSLSTIIHRELDGFTIGPGTWDTLQRHKKYHLERGNGFGYGLHQTPIAEGEVTRTISARYHKDGAEILIAQADSRPRRLSIEEAMRLQGFNHERFVFPVSNTQAYRQIGNSVVIPAVKASAKEIARILAETTRNHERIAR